MKIEEIENLLMGWDPEVENPLGDSNVIIVQQKEEKEGMEARELVFGEIDYLEHGVQVFFLDSEESEIIPFESIIAIYPVRNREEATALAKELLGHLVKLVINPSLLQKVFTPREKN